LDSDGIVAIKIFQRLYQLYGLRWYLREFLHRRRQTREWGKRAIS